MRQDAGTAIFHYELDLQQDGPAISGSARSRSEDGRLSATFQVSGRWDGQLLQLQEIRQLTPDAPQWCLKFAQLQFQLQAGEAVLHGPWTAKGCAPGTLELKRPLAGMKELPFEMTGRWSGQLFQSDRDYGFYYEIELQQGGLGTSHIVSEDNGGEARHRLRWQQVDGTVYITEETIVEKTDPRWRWCIKQAQLILTRHGDIYRLTGNWSGFIEGHTPETGPCAPGQLLLEKAVLTQPVLDQIAEDADPYEAETDRKVRVDRVIRVKSDKIHIRVWDSGTVDGDIVTIFLNGKRILEKFRVNKRRWSIPVQVQPGENLLILHAEDLGDIIPNTVAVAIDDGVEEQLLIISSDLRESGAVLIQPFSLGAGSSRQ